MQGIDGKHCLRFRQAMAIKWVLSLLLFASTLITGKTQKAARLPRRKMPETYRLKVPEMAGKWIACLLLLSILSSQASSAVISGPIKTVVVLVMENRSFDHMLGYMKRLNPEINGVTGTESNPISTTDPGSSRVTFKLGSPYVDPDPGHSFQAIREQIFGSNDTSARPAPMNGFAQQAFSMSNSTDFVGNVMSGFDPSQIAVYQSLVTEFAVFDRWFASVPASTQPNRLYVHSATSNGATSNMASLLVKGYPQKTIFESLEDEGLSFGIYFQNIPATLFYRNLRKLKYITKFHPYDLSFKGDAKAGKLPNYVVVEQRYIDTKLTPANDDHPSHDVYQGQMFVKEVYETLRSSPQWNQTLFIITYDEHGGFFDHVPTPVDGVPSPDDIVGPDPFFFRFDRLGVRVPTIIASPWINKGTVVHGPNGVPFPSSEFEHSSIPATVKKLFNLSSPFLTKRDAWAGTFESIVQGRVTPRTDCPVQLPTPSKIRMGEANEDAKLSEFQQELVQLAAVLNGDNLLTSFPDKIGEKMSVREGQNYMEDSLKRFFEASFAAIELGVDEEQIVKMRPSLTTRTSPTTNLP
ncbi:non-specific phospholipase C2 [Amborella trichopoda]|nr:non-specific phospholipase C2 [Amborella trichopoda]|eukprot:XP_006854823.2 non-specific phospholipase C2 [Amborella trichopoda]